MIARALITLTAGLSWATVAMAQTPPSAAEIAAYNGLHAAAARGDTAALQTLLTDGADTEIRDNNGRTPLHVAAFGSHEAALEVLVAAGADPTALDDQRYDIVTIAAVANDPTLLRRALALGGDPTAVTSPYDGTALIAAAHLGHVTVVDILIAAGAPLDHVNNLGWTALIEAVVLGDGGPRHQAIAAALLKAGASKTIADRAGRTPLALARQHGHAALVRLLE